VSAGLFWGDCCREFANGKGHAAFHMLAALSRQLQLQLRQNSLHDDARGAIGCEFRQLIDRFRSDLRLAITQESDIERKDRLIDLLLAEMLGDKSCIFGNCKSQTPRLFVLESLLQGWENALLNFIRVVKKLGNDYGALHGMNFDGVVLIL